MRVVSSLVLLLAVITVMAAAPCLACGLNARSMQGGACCHQSGGCGTPSGKTLHLECGTPAVEALLIEKASTDAGCALVEAAPAYDTAEAVLPVAVEPAGPDLPSDSPPELYLLNSVLTL